MGRELRRFHCSLNFIRFIILRVVITPSVTSLRRGENDSKQSDEIQAIFTAVVVVVLVSVGA